MSAPSTLERRLAIGVGVIILAASTTTTIDATGGYHSPHAKLILALACGVAVGAYIIGRAWSMSPRLAIALVIALGAGELYNLGQTAERVVNSRETGRAPAHAALEAHEAAQKELATVETSEVSSTRLTLALANAKAAKDAYEAEAANIRCGKECLRKQGIADTAATEVKAAIAEADAMKAKAIETAKADLEAHPLPASGTAFADDTGVPSWLVDIGFAALLSIGANGLAATLIAFGAYRTEVEPVVVKATDTIGQSDFPAIGSPDNVVRFFRPDDPKGPKRGGPDRPKKPGPSGGVSKSDALDDLMQRLADGRTIGSQDELASDWNRPKQTVSDWLREWRRIGVIPAPVQAGRCKATSLA